MSVSTYCASCQRCTVGPAVQYIHMLSRAFKMCPFGTLDLVRCSEHLWHHLGASVLSVSAKQIAVCPGRCFNVSTLAAALETTSLVVYDLSRSLTNSTYAYLCSWHSTRQRSSSLYLRSFLGVRQIVNDAAGYLSMRQRKSYTGTPSDTPSELHAFLNTPKKYNVVIGSKYSSLYGFMIVFLSFAGLAVRAAINQLCFLKRLCGW